MQAAPNRSFWSLQTSLWLAECWMENLDLSKKWHCANPVSRFLVKRSRIAAFDYAALWRETAVMVAMLTVTFLQTSSDHAKRYWSHRKHAHFMTNGHDRYMIARFFQDRLKNMPVLSAVIHGGALRSCMQFITTSQPSINSIFAWQRFGFSQCNGKYHWTIIYTLEKQ